MMQRISNKKVLGTFFSKLEEKQALVISSNAIIKSRIVSSLNDSYSYTQRKRFSTAKGDGPNDYSYSNNDERFSDFKPTLEYAKGLPKRFSAMRHEQILQLCVEGSHEARREALIRDVMSVDEIEYDDAETVVSRIARENRKYMHFEYLPYQTGIGIAAIGGVVSFPMLFDIDTVLWFNEKYVTAEVPGDADLQTWLEVGSFSWSWMEPLIGQASFIFLVLQYLRGQAVNLGLKPYGHLILSIRADRMIKTFPQYDPIFLAWFAESEARYGASGK